MRVPSSRDLRVEGIQEANIWMHRTYFLEEREKKWVKGTMEILKTMKTLRTLGTLVSRFSKGQENCFFTSFFLSFSLSFFLSFLLSFFPFFLPSRVVRAGYPHSANRT